MNKAGKDEKNNFFGEMSLQDGKTRTSARVSGAGSLNFSAAYSGILGRLSRC